MTDARFPERWLNDRRVLRLSDAAFRLFVCGLAWSVANKTDGYLSDEDLALIPGVNLEAAEALYDAELWWSHMHGAQITEFEDTQSSRDELDALAARRRNDRRRKAAERARKATSASRLPSASRDSSRDSHAERVRTGQARPGAKTEVKPPRGFQPNSAMLAEPETTPPEATVTPLLRRKLASEFTTARTRMVLTFKTSLIEVHPGASLRTVTRARPAPSAA
jgi:hypothetical protein